MTSRLTRRRALGALGTVSLGALLGACGVGRDNAGDAVTSADVETTAGKRATVSPQTSAGSASVELFDGTAACTLTPEQTEGPYYVDVDAIRSDIREDRQGARLRLAMRVQDAEGCTPLPNALVEIWHCDAGGV